MDLYDYPLSVSVSIPHVYLPLVIGMIIQIVCVAGAHRLTTRVSALTVTLILVICKAIGLIFSIMGIMHVGITILVFVSLALAKIPSVLRLNESTLWNLFGLGRSRCGR
jgi:UDP-xylose/UDP-N-acetylglucosamine transporter B4